jgi:diguanylate cyclase (GGDEF)-like protein
VLSQFSLLIAVHVLSSIVLVALLVLVLLNRHEVLAPWLGGAFAALLLWSVTYTLELAAHGLSAKLAWANVQFIGATALPVFWLQAMRVATRSRPLPHWLLAVVWLLAIAIIGCVYADPGGLFRGRPTLEVSGDMVLVAADYGPSYFFIWVPFAWGLLAVSAAVLARGSFHPDPLLRGRSRLLLAATLLPMVAGGLFSAGLSPWPNFNPTIASLSIAAGLCSVALLRHRLLAWAPLARDTVVEQLLDGVIVCNADGLLIDFNPAARAILPELTPEKLGSSLDEVLLRRPEFARAREAAHAVCSQTALATFAPEGTERADVLEPATLSVVDPAASEEAVPRYYSLRIAPVLRKNGRCIAEAFILHDVTHRIQLQSSLQRLAATDELTGLLARRELLDLGEKELIRCNRESQPIAALLIDLDSFKPVNDHLGHAAGDRVLKAVAEACTRQLRTCDLFARYGGDELCILLPGLSLDHALAVAERLRAAVAGLSVWCDATLVRITVSIGVAVSTDHSSTLRSLIETADVGLYQAKRQGGNRVSVVQVSGADGSQIDDLVGPTVQVV